MARKFSIVCLYKSNIKIKTGQTLKQIAEDFRYENIF